MCLCAGALRKQEVTDLFVTCTLCEVLGLKFWCCSRAVSTLRLLSHPSNRRIKLLAMQIQQFSSLKITVSYHLLAFILKIIMVLNKIIILLFSEYIFLISWSCLDPNPRCTFVLQGIISFLWNKSSSYSICPFPQ